MILNNASGISHIGSRDRWQNKELVQLMGDILDKEIKWKYAPDRLGHDFRYSMDSSKTRKNLNWKPKTDFDEGLDLTIKWYTERK